MSRAHDSYREPTPQQPLPPDVRAVYSPHATLHGGMHSAIMVAVRSVPDGRA
jgi:hypothetical protein